MKTILVPVDFTDASDNAVNFASSWAIRYGYNRIILFKTFYESMFEHLALGADYIVANKEDLNRQREEGVHELASLRDKVLSVVSENVEVMTEISELPLLRGMIELIKEEGDIELVLLGSDNHIQSQKSFISANVISIAKVSPVKVLIVPADHTYQPVTDILVPCDVSTLSSLERLDRIKTNAQPNGGRLHILNVDKRGQSASKEKEDYLHDYLKDFQHEIYTIADKDVLSGILTFTANHKIQLIIALPGKHSFLYSLTNKSISEAIYMNAKQPVLILK
ncbi:MAG: hypothetical protein QM764_03300 [Chitinophagaceae bacterium]